MKLIIFPLMLLAYMGVALADAAVAYNPAAPKASVKVVYDLSGAVAKYEAIRQCRLASGSDSKNCVLRYTGKEIGFAAAAYACSPAPEICFIEVSAGKGSKDEASESALAKCEATFGVKCKVAVQWQNNSNPVEKLKPGRRYSDDEVLIKANDFKRVYDEGTVEELAQATKLLMGCSADSALFRELLLTLKYVERHIVATADQLCR